MKIKYLSTEKIYQLPKNTGVYLLKNKKGEIIYIGKAINIKERVKNHFQQQNYRDNLFIGQVSKIGYVSINSEIEALILEANLIKKYKPRYNIVWRDDKNYFYIAVTNEDFPQIFITHQPNQKSKIEYIGPFVDGNVLKQALKILRKIFPYRTCGRLPKRPCLWYQLNRCQAPCLLKSGLAKQIPNLENQIKKESRKNAKNIIKILKGQKLQVLRKLKIEMRKTSTSQNFEKAAEIRDQFRSLERIFANAKIFEPQNESLYKWTEVEKELRKILGIKKQFSKIEAYDISNIQGKNATGAMVAFVNGKPNKNLYRKFKIGISGKPNDVAMIKEVLYRRFHHHEWPFPDLILIDGGIGQLNVALRIKNSESIIKDKIKVVSLAKKYNELFIEGKKKPLLLKNLPREIFNLILQLRDEAHRFAIKYHLKLRERNTFV